MLGLIRSLQIARRCNQQAWFEHSANLLGVSHRLDLLRVQQKVFGKSQSRFVDNGPEYVSGTVVSWAEKHGIALKYIQPGKLQQNVYIERFNQTVRYDFLVQHLFEDLEQIQEHATD